MIAYVRACWGDYLNHPWARKMVAAGLGVELVSIWVMPWFWGFWR